METTKKKQKKLEKINQPIKIFLSYSHSDREYKDTLMKHLSLLIRKNQIELWDDEKITAGSNWKDEIEVKLKEADIAVLLISSDFLSSNFINEFEIPRLLEQSKKGETTIIPILVRPVYWQESELSRFQGLPKKGKAISHWLNEDEAWINVVSELAKAIERKQKGQSETKFESKWTVENIKKFIANGQMTQAIKELEELVEQKGDNEELMNSLILMNGRLNQLKINSRLGILSHHNEMLERNKIAYSILNLLEEL